MKLGLGTVQFGFDYGVSNDSGRTPIDEVGAILKQAEESGISVLDTAADYGKSEEVLGKCLSDDRNIFNIVTKSPSFNALEIGKGDVEKLEKVFYQSLEKLGSTSVYGLLIHDADELLKPGGNLLVDKINELKQEGKVKKIGASVYCAKQIDKLLEIFTPDILQIPINIFDQRLLISGHLKLMDDLGIELHARSIFLQGLLLMELEDIPEYFSSVHEHIKKYYKFLKEMNLSKLQGALYFVNQLKEIDVVLVGINSKNQLSEIENAYNLKNIEMIDTNQFSLNDEKIINPSNWQVKQ